MATPLKKAQAASHHLRHYRDASRITRQALEITRRNDGLDADNPHESEAKEFSDVLRMGRVPAHQYYLTRKKLPANLVVEYQSQFETGGRVPGDDDPAFEPGRRGLDDNDNLVGTEDDANPSSNEADSALCGPHPRGNNADDACNLPRSRLRQCPPLPTLALATDSNVTLLRKNGST